MKTRIKIIEYNNGRKEYECEVDSPFPFWIMFTLIGIPVYLIYLHSGNWSILEKRSKDSYISLSGQKVTKYEDAIFDNIEDAKKCIDEYIAKKKEAERIEFLSKEKSTTYEKYP